MEPHIARKEPQWALFIVVDIKIILDTGISLLPCIDGDNQS